MDKLKMETEDLTSENIEKLKELFPSVVSDGKIDFDKLKQELSADIVKTVDSYDFTWVGKHEDVRKANEPVNAVLLCIIVFCKRVIVKSDNAVIACFLNRRIIVNIRRKQFRRICCYRRSRNDRCCKS